MNYEQRTTSSYGNQYYFQGKCFDVLDDGNLVLGIWPYRNYSTYTGRWHQQEKLGMIPNDDQKINPFEPQRQYADGSNLYLAFGSSPVGNVDKWGLVFIVDYGYKVGNNSPPDSPFDHGPWNVATAPVGTFLYDRLKDIYARAHNTADLGFLTRRDARRHLKRYLQNNGGVLFTDYFRLLKDSQQARDDFVILLTMAMQYAEGVAECDKTISIVQKGHAQCQVTDDQNWRYAIQTYWPWGKGNDIKKFGGKHGTCCYQMSWTLNLRDNYEFENQHTVAGLVYDDEMWLLNHYGWAKHFKIRGVHKIGVVWPKGFRFKKADGMDLITGKQRRFPQCQ